MVLLAQEMNFPAFFSLTVYVLLQKSPSMEKFVGQSVQEL
jgi:hypothetical protein